MSATVSAPSTVTEGWPHIACKLDKGPASRAAIGLITLANDLTIENELNRFLSIDGVCVLSTRIPRTSHGTVSSLQDMEQHLTEASKLITPDEHLDVIAYGCTSGSMAIGPEVVAERIHAARPEVACANPVSASLKGLRALDCQQIAVLNPYSDEVNEVVERFVTDQGFDVVDKASFDQGGDPYIGRVPPEAIYDAGLELGRASNAQALFISCTALRVSPILGRLEAALGKPVVSSNQALAWDCLRQAGCDATVEGFGRLLSEVV